VGGNDIWLIGGRREASQFEGEESEIEDALSRRTRAMLQVHYSTKSEAGSLRRETTASEQGVQGNLACR
jgi:hypothetical protein